MGEMLVSLQNNTFSRADLSNEKGVAKNVHYGDVLIKFGEVLDVSKEQLPMITDEKVLTKYKASFLKNGDVIVADTAEDITVGKCSEIEGLNDEVVLSGLHTIPYRPVEKFATGYLGYYLNSRAYHNQLIPLMQGIKVTSISKSAMQDTDIVYPKLLKEQAMIGNYFQSIDHLITLHQRKYLSFYKAGEWLVGENNPVSDYIDFAKKVLRIPQAHEMIARYTVLDKKAKKLILLRPYQIHAIEAIRAASKVGQSGFVWHTTGSGKTLTSYKATRNLLMDIPSIDKAIFLIDRKDLDTQTTMAFQAYANNDLIDVNDTENVNDLKKKLKADDRQVIVTTIQKLQRLVTKRLKEGTSEYNKIRGLKIAFVVDECHRAVSPGTKRELENTDVDLVMRTLSGL